MIRALMKQRMWRSLLLYPRFQLVFVGYALIGALVMAVVLQTTHTWLHARFIQDAIAAGMPANDPYFKYIDEQRRIFSYVFAVSVAISIVLLPLGGFLLSHRVAGPLFRLKQHLSAIALGQSPEPLKFREGDYFRELVEPYNAAIDKLRASSKPE